MQIYQEIYCRAMALCAVSHFGFLIGNSYIMLSKVLSKSFHAPSGSFASKKFLAFQSLVFLATPDRVADGCLMFVGDRGL
jgi:hypothetical protein